MNVEVESYMLRQYECIVRCHLTAGRGMMIAFMKLQGIEVNRRLNGYDKSHSLGIAGSPYSDS